MSRLAAHNATGCTQRDVVWLASPHLLHTHSCTITVGQCPNGNSESHLHLSFSCEVYTLTCMWSHSRLYYSSSFVEAFLVLERSYVTQF